MSDSNTINIFGAGLATVLVGTGWAILGNLTNDPTVSLGALLLVSVGFILIGATPADDAEDAGDERTGALTAEDLDDE